MQMPGGTRFLQAAASSARYRATARALKDAAGPDWQLNTADNLPYDKGESK